MKINSFKNSLYVAIVSAMGAASLSLNAVANVEEQDDDIEEVFVTGTHIKGVDVEGAMPAKQLTSDDILSSGADSIADLLKEMSVTGGGQGTFTSASGGPGSGSTPVGAAGVSFRGLGTSSTLTLVNGRRVSVSSFANGQESFVDINSIPKSAIERIEILPSGASAIYGADAVAGVINIILKDSFEGGELYLNHGNSTAETDEGRVNVSGAYGFSSENSQATLILDYAKRNGFYNRDRDNSAQSLDPSKQGTFPSFGLFSDGPGSFTVQEKVEDSCNTQIGSEPAYQYCEYNQNLYSGTQSEQESLGLVGIFNYELGDITWFNEYMSQAYYSQGTSTGANYDGILVNNLHPNLPQSLYDNIIADGGDFANHQLYAYGRFTDPRAIEVESTTYRFISGLKGSLLEFDWETAVSYSQNDSTQRGLTGLYKRREFEAAMLGQLCADGSFNSPYGDVANCATEIDGLHYNPFGGQASQNEAVLNAIQTQAERVGKSSSIAFDAKMTGELFDLPAGTVFGAWGLEARRDSVKDTPDSAAVATDNNPDPIIGFSSTSADYSRSQQSAFVEFYVPIIENMEMQLAGRYDHYEDFGGDFNPKVGFRYQPIEEIIFRGSWSTSFRAPSLAQAGAGVRLASDNVDCDEPGMDQVCLGGSARADLTEELGNPELKPETSENTGFGFIARPFESTKVTVDYWQIDYKNLVEVNAEDFVRVALMDPETYVFDAGLLPTGQAGIELARNYDAEGNLTEQILVDLHLPLQNIGYQKTSGVDFSIEQEMEFSMGDLTLWLDGTQMLKFEEQVSELSPVEKEVGEYTYPEYLFGAGARWAADDYRISLSASYTDSYKDDPGSDLIAQYNLSEERKIPSMAIVRLSGSYDVNADGTLSMSINNLTDREPPLVYGSGRNYDVNNYSNLGRFISIGYTHQF